MLRLGVLASRQGTNFQAVVDAARASRIHSQVVLLITNNSKAPVVGRAAKANIPFVHLSSRTHPDPAELDAAVLSALESANSDLVILAGYMKKLGEKTLHRYAGRLINVHPSLLPAHGGKGMYGRRVHESVLAAGDKVTGATVHHVTADYDKGPVILQEKTNVMPGDRADSLAARVQEIEHRLMVEAINRFENGCTGWTEKD